MPTISGTSGGASAGLSGDAGASFRAASGAFAAALVPRVLGEILATQEPVKLLALPFPMPSYAVKQHWHTRFHADAGNVWLRRTVAQLFSGPHPPDMAGP